MAVKAFDLISLGKAGLVNPEQVGYEDSIEIIRDETLRVQKSFVKIGWYLKHIRDDELYKEDGYIRLQPENDTMDPIIVTDLQILGKVIGIFRFFD